MTVKQKFDRIDQSKLGQAQVDILKMMAQKTDNFKTKDKATLDKIDASLDKIISALQEKNPDALKSTAKKTSTAKTATKGSKGGKTAMQLAKDIRKPNESWNEAVKRAGAIMRGDAKKASKVVTSELQKLKTFVNRRKQLKGIAGTDLLRDSKRQAKPKGKRKSKEGNVYYEYRENRIDRLAPNYPKNSPYLETGGGVDDNWELKKIYADEDGSYGKVVHNGKEVGDYEFDRFAMTFWVTNPKGGQMSIDTPEELFAFYKAKEFAMAYELGGGVDASMEYDLAGNTSGGTGGLNADMPLSDVSGTAYTDLVGETGSMSAGEMFARGGSTDHKYLNHSEDYEVRYAKGKNRRGYGNLGFANGGATDHKYLNHSEDYEVRYAKGKNRRGYGNLKFELGGATMANQEVIADASQQYVNYYLGEGANQGMFATGGAIKNQYAGRTPEDIWNNMDISQKLHFLSDHAEEVYGSPIVKGQTNPKMNEFFGKLIYEKYDDLPLNTKVSLSMHTSRGQYAKGAMVDSKYNVSIEYPSKSSRSNWGGNDNVDIKVIAKNKVEAENKALDEFSKKFPMQKPKYVRVTKDEASSSDNFSLKQGGMMPMVSRRKHRND